MIQKRDGVAPTAHSTFQCSGVGPVDVVAAGQQAMCNVGRGPLQCRGTGKSRAFLHDGLYRLHFQPELVAGLLTTGIPASQTVFVSSNGWDALAATWYGFRTLWVNRSGLPPEELGPPPTRTGTSLRDVLEFFNRQTPSSPLRVVPPPLL